MKRVLLLIFLFTGIFSFSQSVENSQFLTASLRDIKFFDDSVGIAYGQNVMMRTTDGGQNWNFVAMPIPEYVHNSTLADTEIVNAEKAFIIGGFNTFLKTINKGETWEPVAVDLSFTGDITYQSIDFADEEVGYATGYVYNNDTGYTNKFFIKTVDGGGTWNQFTATFNGFIGGVNFRFINENVGIGWSGASLYKTTNGGLQWVEVPSTAFNTLYNGGIGDIQIAADNKLVLSGNQQFYTSDDLGATWNQITELTESNGYYFNTMTSIVKDNVLYAMGSLNGDYDSVNLIKYNLDTGDVDIVPTNKPFIYPTGISVVNPDLIYVIDNGEGSGTSVVGRIMYRTETGGQDWTAFDSYTNTAHLDATGALQNGPNKFTLTKDDGYNSDTTNPNFYLFTSQDNGATWQQKDMIANTRGKLLRAEGDYISYIYQSNIVNVMGDFFRESYDFGQTWQTTHIDVENVYWAPNFRQINENIVSYEPRVVMDNIKVSPDKAQTWITVPLPNGDEIFETLIKSMDEIYAWGLTTSDNTYNYHLYKTTDLGASWQEIVMIPGTPEGYFSTTRFGESIALIAIAGNSYYKVDLNNNTFSEIDFNDPVPGSILLQNDSLFVFNDSTWMIKHAPEFMTYYDLYITGDAGLTWEQVPCLLCEHPEYNNATGSLTIYQHYYGLEAIATNFPVMPVVSGNTTVELDSIETYTVANNSNDLEWSLESGGILTETSQGVQVQWTTLGEHVLKVKAVNDFGTSAYKRLIITVNEELGLTGNSKNTFKVYPNPFSGEITLLPDGLNGSTSLVKITSLNGVVVFNEVLQNSDLTIKGLSILSNGVYFISLENDGRKYIQKLVKN
ncbi:YCF48-related protein [Flavobacterium sp. RHBU_24]|uniref:T9SS type A sorting domain-containing protein n=1 Tax=Flavobacterium sp. RHBU_24 TaxID=3391185 RepID=UPI003984A824